MAYRHIKKTVADLLRGSDMAAGMEALCGLPARQVVNPLFGLLYSGDQLIRWRAVVAMGAVVSHLAAQSMESARIIMRRCMWNLNDESGGIGWGTPEAMGEIMARHDGLAREYAAILVSYADPCGNFLEHPGLQWGVLWALGRLGRVNPRLVQPAAIFLPPFLSSTNPSLRGVAIWAAIALQIKALESEIRPWLRDSQSVTIYADGHLRPYIIGRLAQEAIRQGA